MSADDENRFRPKPGRIRSDTPKAGKAKSFLTQAKKLARQHGNSPSRSSSSSPARSGPKQIGRAGKASRTGGAPGLKRRRGAAFVRAQRADRQQGVGMFCPQRLHQGSDRWPDHRRQARPREETQPAVERLGVEHQRPPALQQAGVLDAKVDVKAALDNLIDDQIPLPAN